MDEKTKASFDTAICLNLLDVLYANGAMNRQTYLKLVNKYSEKKEVQEHEKK